MIVENRCKPEHRSLLACVLRAEPGARRIFAYLVNLGARNMRPDYMLYRTANGNYERAVDPCAWYADCKGGLFVAMIRHSDGEWLLHS